MRIEGTSGLNVGMSGMVQGTDQFSRNIQKQIQSKQQELQKLSENEDLSVEEKMKKRQEIQKEIADLNNQLRMHQFEQRREKQQGKDTEIDEMLGGKRTKSKVHEEKGVQGRKSTDIPQAGMQAIISADSSIKQAEVQKSTVVQMEGRARVLKSEIKQDKGYGSAVEKKEEELADIEAKASVAKAAQMSTLGEANKALKDTNISETGNSRKDVENKKDGKNEDENNPEAEQLNVKEDQKQQNDFNILNGIYTPVNVLV